MSNHRRQFIESLAALAALPLLGQAQEKIEPVRLRGRIVSLTEALKENQIPFFEDARSLMYCLKTADGKLYPILPSDTAAAIYDDERFRKRELQITARKFTEAGFLEVMKIQGIKWGRVFDLYFYCIICNIRSHKGGPCECCQDPFEFVEEPSKEQ